MDLDPEQELAELRRRYEDLCIEEKELIEKVGDVDIVQYIKLTVRETRDNNALTKPAVSGIQLIQVDGTDAQFRDAWCNTWSSSIKPEHIIDGKASTAWRDEKHRPVILELREPAALMGYRMRTSCDNPNTDPKHWLLEGSIEKDGAWHVLHEMTEDAKLPKDRSAWSIMIPIKSAEVTDPNLVRAITEGDKAEQERRYSMLDKQAAMELSRNGPTKAEVLTMTQQAMLKKEETRMAQFSEEEKRKELSRFKKLTADLEKRNTYVCTVLQEMVKELMELVTENMTRSDAAGQIDLRTTLDVVEEVEKEREDELSAIQVQTDASRSDDNVLTQSLTDLQNKTLVRLPQIREECDNIKRQMLNACDKELAALEDIYAQLEAKNRELAYHTKRGTNYKQAWTGNKEKAAPRFDDEFESVKSAEDSRRRQDDAAELASEIKRLTRQKVDLTNDLKKIQKECLTDTAKLRRQFNEIHKERSLLGQERCELEAICSDFSALIEKLSQQLGVSGQRIVSSNKSVPPLSNNFTLGHGRLSPRPMTSPRRSVSPRPISRTGTPRTPRVSVTPRRIH
eukprot:TRINITY_DN13377_c0_g1_i4.p1 TRINITY_DN13377_c0_g1~~TRINITY_DN13377_c0_g1_i4.p1  ORF type:complete len:567 (+),score=223.47 TRINITY_DN13377_c0_g1_i4:40-1740(+)